METANQSGDRYSHIPYMMVERCFDELSVIKGSSKRTQNQSPNSTIYRPSMENKKKWSRLWYLLYETYGDLHGRRIQEMEFWIVE
ncbi:hypothetical protein R6Q59_010689 [Mikania micrantha]